MIAQSISSASWCRAIVCLAAPTGAGLKQSDMSPPIQHLLAGDPDVALADPAIPAVADIMIEDGVAGDPDAPEDEEADDDAQEVGDGDGAGGGDAGADLAALAVALPVALPDNADFAEANKQIRAVCAIWF